MKIKQYDRVLLKDGNAAIIVEVFAPDRAFLADIEKDGDIYTEDVTIDEIQQVIVGLRTQESIKFERYFAIIQVEAEKNNAVFYAEAGDGTEFETEFMEGEIMMGWLIPHDKTNEFEALWRSSEVDDAWTDFFTWAVWAEKDGEITVRFDG